MTVDTLEHQRDPTEQVHRRVDRTLTGVVHRGIAGFGRDHHQRQQRRFPTVDLELGHHLPPEGPALRRHDRLSQALSTPLTIDLDLRRHAPPQGPTTRSPAGTSSCRPGQTSLQVADPDRDRTTSSSPTGSSRSRWPRAPPTRSGSPSSVSVTITSSVVPTLTISTNTSTVAQGGAATFTITADQPPVKDTSVNFTVQGTAAAGPELRAAAGTALLKAGQTQVTVVLQSLQTNVTFEPTDMIVGQWPTRVGQVFVKAGAPVAPGEADPLAHRAEPDRDAAGLGGRPDQAAGGPALHRADRRARQRSAPGTITELDSTPTTVTRSSGGQSQQVYEGRIEVSGPHGRRRLRRCRSTWSTSRSTTP